MRKNKNILSQRACLSGKSRQGRGRRGLSAAVRVDRTAEIGKCVKKRGQATFREWGRNQSTVVSHVSGVYGGKRASQGS